MAYPKLFKNLSKRVTITIPSDHKIALKNILLLLDSEDPEILELIQRRFLDKEP